MADVFVIECGEVCRDHEKIKSELYVRAKAHMEATGTDLWPTEALMAAVESHFVQAAMEHDVICLDGFLRIPDQVVHIEQFVVANKIDSFVVIEVEATDATCVRRAKERGRADDARIEQRLLEYHQFTEPAIAILMNMSIEPRPQRIIMRSNKDGTSEVTPFITGLMSMYALPAAVPSLLYVA